jgi:uncharacterized protein (DUF427 family)
VTPDLPRWARAGRAQWSNTGAHRPAFAVEPDPGQESVWDYPRPPAIVADTRSIQVAADGQTIASSTASARVLETSSPPAFYLPPDDVVTTSLVVVPGSSRCEWKGEAEYLALAGTSAPIAWRYPTPFADFATLAGWISFYPARVRCTVDGELVRAQAGGFYGGWITDDVVGPFKGDPGTSAW